jgi:two-component system heavy metal sensor histidine kinase CusS
LKLWIYDSDGRTLFSSSQPEIQYEIWAEMAAPYRHPSPARLWHDAQSRAHRFIVAAYESGTAPARPATLVLALDVSDESAVLRSFAASVFGAVVGGSLLATLIGLLIARRSLQPVVRIAESARRITVSQLDERLDAKGTPTELAMLVDSFNTTLSRLEESFRRLSDFSADLAHELRTPLSNLLGRTQVVLSQRRTSDEYREALEASVEDIQQLSALVSDMLFLAQADHAEAALAYERIDLHSEAEHVVDFFAAAAEERGISVTVQGAAEIHADRQKIRRAMANLLSNAIRHSPDGEPVEVTIAAQRADVSLAVRNRGPGIAAEHQSRVFDRFYRVDASRTRKSGGTGLGLAIVRSIARLHGGDVTVTGEPERHTTFTLVLPTEPRERMTDS